MPARPAAGGGRWVDVAPDRLTRWLNGFSGRHGQTGVELDGGVVHLRAADGSAAQLYPPPGAPLTETVEDFVDAALTERRLGLLLARQSAVAVGIAEGPRLTESKVGTSYVQSRTAAGGWSQQRFARRRANQAKAAAEEAADIAVRLLLPAVATLACVVAGGDRRTVEGVLADPRLAPVAAARAERFLDVPEPRRTVLEQAVAQARAIRVRVVDA
jgi:peptide subunit release factor 1 (eRF1)